MESRRSLGSRKRSTRSPEVGYWDCSVCTYRNNADAFKCDMCDVRKGTSTRKPRLNAQVVAQQRAQELMIPQVIPPKQNLPTRKETSRPGALRKSHSGGKRSRPRLKNVDRSSAITTEVIVNDVPVIITEYKEKPLAKTVPQETSPSNTRKQVNGNVE